MAELETSSEGFTLQRAGRIAGWSAALVIAALVGRTVAAHVVSTVPVSTRLVMVVTGAPVLLLYILAEYRRTRTMPSHPTWRVDVTLVFLIYLVIGRVLIRWLDLCSAGL